MSDELKRLGRFTSLVTEKAEDAEFKLALEHVEGWTGRLASDVEVIESGSEELGGEGIRFRSGDILFGKLRPYLAKAWVADRDGAAVGDFHVYRPSRDIHPKFLLYSLLRREYIDEVNASTYGSKMPRASWDYVKGALHHVPGLERQLRIAEFLDRETAQIDELIAKQEQLISTLAERRQAATGAAVTRGLDADVALRDSGDVAVGKIPVTWKFSKLAYLFDLIGSGTTPPSEQVPDHYGEGIPWVTTGELRENTIFETAKRVTPTAIKSLSALKVYPAGSLVIAMYGATIGRLGVLGVSATTNQACCVLAKPRGVLADFVYLALQASQSRLLVRAYGGGQPNISQEVVRQFRLAVPPVAEQRRIVDHLSGLVADTKALEERANESIALLRERRQALISAAVTGQIDVGGAS